MPSDASKPLCRETVAAMYLFLDKELDGVTLEQIQAHLADCPPCWEAFEFEAELKTVIATRCREDVPVSLYERVQMTIRAEISSPSDKPS